MTSCIRIAGAILCSVNITTLVLYKRDFAGEMMMKYSDLLLLDYGFVYHRDNHFKGDDFTWFLMEKSQS